jgi:uncharacterized protein
MITEHKANRLINSISPYLLQHAYNPVDWYEWGPEALERARQEDKPIIVSIGYSSCHWCHVMERESFEKMHVAALMNEHYVCIKVDREERPDIDQIYMDAVHALGIQGGWPLNVFLTPDQKPFFGGTYFSPEIWVQVLENISNAFKQHRDRIEGTAEELRVHLQRSDISSYSKQPVQQAVEESIKLMFNKLSSKFDHEWGGLDKAPKFIMPSVWLWMLRYYHLTEDEGALEHINLTLKKIARGGIYDQIGGGFARYSVDAYWFAPHFEKMLYDNAQLLSLYSEAFAITKDEEYKSVVYETFEWLQREMTSDEGGFFSALDADSEGVEGRFYVWTKTEIEKHLGENAALLCDYYNVDDEGNWEHGANILNRAKGDEAFIVEHELTKAQWDELSKRMKKSLLRERNARVRPGLDDKIITAWNAMTITGLCDAYKAFDDRRFLKAAVLNMRFLENELMESTKLYRSYKDKRANISAFLDDYAFLIQAQLKLYEVTFDEYWLRRSEAFMNHVIEHFYDATDGYFFYTSDTSEKLLARKKEIFDNVISSSNAIMAGNLFRMGLILEHEEWQGMARKMALSLGELITAEPNFMSGWGIVFTEIQKGLGEVAFMGDDIETLRQEFHIEYQPFTISMGTKGKSTLPLLADKEVTKKKSTMYVCFNKTCYNPVHSIEGVTKQLHKLKL